MKEFVISEVQAETAVLVGLVTKTQDERKTNEYLDELAFLAETAGAEVVKRFTQKLDAAHSVTYVGKGKLEEIKEYIRNEEEAEREIGMVIFDDELSAKQIRNIEAELKIKILDRTSLILDIFAMRAQTANAKTQVELAQYKYMLPRLQRLWTHLERQGGGSGAGGGKGSVGLRGPGETQLEMDRRIILNRMSLLKERLAEIDKQKSTQRKNRGRLIRVALVGYTNVGKSTLMTLLSKSEVFAENKLFATLDTTVRKVIIENLPFLLSDTVGFIRKLPTDLVDSFKSTLDEVREADLLLHIVDISHPDFEEQIEVVNKTLADIGAAVDHVPILAGCHWHSGHGEILVQHIKGGGVAAPAAGDYRRPHLHGLVDAEGAEKQSVHEGGGSACGGSEIHRAADDKGVRLCQFWCNFIDHIVKHAFACLGTFAAGDAATDILVAHMEQLNFDALGLQGVFQFGQGGICAAPWMGTTVY